MKANLEAKLAEYLSDGQKILAKLGEEVSLAKGETLRKSTLTCQDLYYLVDGLCALCMAGPTGKDLNIIYFLPGRLMNFMPALKKFYPRSQCALCGTLSHADYYIEVLRPSKLLRINYQTFLNEYVHSLPLQAMIIQSLMENSYDLLSHLFKSLEMPAWQKVAMELVENMEGPHPHVLPRKITYSEISTHLSLHPVTVAKIFRALQDNGIIERRKDGIRISDPLRIWRIANGEERLFYKTDSRRVAQNSQSGSKKEGNF